MLFLAPDEDTWVGVLRLKLRVPGSRSLKDRRRAVAHVRDRIRARGGFSVSEVGHLHDHQHAVLAVVTVSRESVEVRRALDRLAHDVESWGRALVDARDIRLFRPFDGHGDDDGTIDGSAFGDGWGDASGSSDSGGDDGVPDAPWADP